MPENVGTNDLIHKVLAVSNANTPVFLILIPLEIFLLLLLFFIYLKKIENILLYYH